jgi:cell division protein FtsB
MLIILGIILIALLAWVVYLMVVGGVGFVVAIKAIFTGFRKGWRDAKNADIRPKSHRQLKMEADIARMKAERAAKKESKNAR